MKATQQKPLWMDENARIVFQRQEMFDLFEKETEINFELFAEDYMSVFEVFN